MRSEETMNQKSNPIVEITDRAIVQIQNIFAREKKGAEYGLRIGVVGGGCSGLNYKIDFDKKKEKDNVMDLSGISVFIDLKSAVYLKGVTIDFDDGLSWKRLRL